MEPVDKINVELEVIRRFDQGLKIDLIAWQLEVSCKRVEGILRAWGRI